MSNGKKSKICCHLKRLDGLSIIVAIPLTVFMGNVYRSKFEKIFEKLSSESDIAVDEYGRPRKIILTAGNINDCDVACELLNDFNLQGKTVIADREKYKFRNKIERFFGNLKESRHLATRYDKLASRFLSFVYLASIFSWL